MTVLTAVLNDVQRRTLEAVCDTIVPAVRAGAADDPVIAEYLGRSAGDLGVAGQIEALMGQAMRNEAPATVTSP